jgi:hypothetical protein
VLYEWITGYKLFTGENEMAILKSIIDGKIYPPSYFKRGHPGGGRAHPDEGARAKDREARYQSARDMQFDIDTFVAGSHFSPSNIHMSNFLKQIFDDEIEREKELLVRSRDVAIEPLPEPVDEVLELEDVGGRALTEKSDAFDMALGRSPSLPTSIGRKGSSLEAEIAFRLSTGDLEKLSRSAQRNKLKVDELVRELVRDHLKWLD